MSYIKMNKTSGQALEKMCQRYMNVMESGMDYWEFIETVAISPDMLSQYFKGIRDISREHAMRLADVGVDVASLGWHYEQGKAETEKEREFQKRDAKAAIWQQRKEEIIRKLHEYGIEEVDKTGEYALSEEDYYPIKIILHYLNDRKYLPKLEELLNRCGDWELVHGGSNALVWASQYLSYDKLILLAKRGDFIEKHIHYRNDRGQTLLHSVVDGSGAHENIAKVIHLLVDWGVDANLPDHSQWTPLHYVAHNYEQNRLLWDALIECGADETLKNKDGHTPDEVWERAEAWREAIDAW